MLFIIWFLVESELETRLPDLIPEPLYSVSPLKLFYSICWNLLYWGNLCGCCRQLNVSLDRRGRNKDKEENNIDKCRWRILNFMSHIQFLRLWRCLELPESLLYRLSCSVHTLAKWALLSHFQSHFRIEGSYSIQENLRYGSSDLAWVASYTLGLSDHEMRDLSIESIQGIQCRESPWYTNVWAFGKLKEICQLCCVLNNFHLFCFKCYSYFYAG